MAALSLLAIFGGALQVLGQATHNTAAFGYQACSNIDVSKFGAPLVFPDGRVTPEACQASCQGHQYAALMPNACRCGDDPTAVKSIEESKCDFPCMGDRNFGMCGSVCPDNGPKIANIYARASTQPAATGPAGGGPSQYRISPVMSSDTTCSSPAVAPASASGQPAGIPTITPPGPAPDVKTPGPSLPAIPSPQGPQTSPCSSSGASPGAAAPSPVVGSPHDLPTNAPQPAAYPHPTEPAPAIPTTQAPGGGPGPVSSPLPLTNGQNPGGVPGQQPSGGVNGKPPGASDLSPLVSETTLWPKTSSSKSAGILPVPSQVPGSDSSHGFAPPLLGLGGLALVAAVVM